MKVGNTGCRDVFGCAGPPFLAVAMFALASFKRAQTPIGHVLFTVLLLRSPKWNNKQSLSR